MSIPSAYLASSKNLPGILAAIQEAGVPPRFTNEFLKSLGYTSSNDRAVIGVLKALRFLDDSGSPTERYRAFRSRQEAPYVLASAIREAYADVFLANENAQTLPGERVKGILATKTDKGESVLDKMAQTFRALVSAAKWDRTEEQESEKPVAPKPASEVIEVPARRRSGEQPRESGVVGASFHYDIQIHLPVTKDISVYNAIFKSLKEHLL